MSEEIEKLKSLIRKVEEISESLKDEDEVFYKEIERLRKEFNDAKTN